MPSWTKGDHRLAVRFAEEPVYVETDHSKVAENGYEKTLITVGAAPKYNENLQPGRRGKRAQHG